MCKIIIAKKVSNSLMNDVSYLDMIDYPLLFAFARLHVVRLGGHMNNYIVYFGKYSKFNIEYI